MKYAKIQALLQMNGLSLQEYSKRIGMKELKSVYLKKQNDRCTADELIILAEMTNTQLAFIDEHDRPIIIFTPDDLSKKKG